MHRVRVTGARPDFRVFIGLLYSDLHNVDTDGDSYVVHTRAWTKLYLRDREGGDPFVWIGPDAEAGYFEIESASARLEQLAALYLHEYCGDRLEANGRALSADEIAALAGRYARELERGRASIWHQSSDALPYPNQRLGRDG